MRRSWMMVLLGALLAPGVLAQGWMQVYEKGLSEAKLGNWEAARKSFEQAAAYRPDDVSGPTNLPGPVTERRQWRNGAPYSPRFLAAYSAYRMGATMSGNLKSEYFRIAAAEMEALHAKAQYSPESFYYLSWIYMTLNESEKRLKLDERFASVKDKIGFRVDVEPLAPEEIAAVANMMGRSSDSGAKPPRTTPATQPPATTPTTNPATGPVTIGSALGTRIPVLPNKYALIIGNSASRIAGQEVPYASDDAQRIREGLTLSAGYAAENVDLVLNATASQMLSSARALADRIPEGAIVFLYFSGVGANLDGKDYLAGIDAESATDSSAMAAKSEIYRLFVSKRARIFAFFQAPRPTVAGRYFGMEVPMYGSVSQCQATMPGDPIFSQMKEGKSVGLFTDALVATLNEFRSNQIPIMEFGWQLFYRIRRGDTGRDGGSSRQTPTLPVLTLLATDAKF